jgi:hypothetical protein
MNPCPFFLLIPFVLVTSLAIVGASRLVSQFRKRPPSKHVVTFPRALCLVSVATVVILAVDYSVFQARERKASRATTACGGELDHISIGWPGTRYYARFDRPLSDRELAELTDLNLLVARNAVIIQFQCEIDGDRLKAVRDAFPDCEVQTFSPIK